MLSFFRILISLFSFILLTGYFTLTLTRIHAAIFEIQNNCIYTVWAAAVPGGGRELRQGQSWVVNSDPNSYKSGVIWARTDCNFNEKGIGKCQTGDCDGLFYCVSSPTLNKTSPTTLAEYNFPESRNNLDFFDITLVNGFNVPMEFRATSTTCSQGVKCAADINSLCPTELRDPGGCNHPCTVFNNDQFCCPSPSNCRPSTYFKFFKDLCPNVYTYAFDDANSTFSCPSGTNYTVIFCP